MRTADFDYALPADLIAQAPAAERDASRLLVLNRATGSIEHSSFRTLPTLLSSGDVLVLNDSRVIPARLRGFKPETNGEVELLLLEETAPNEWWTMVRPGKRVRPGTKICLCDSHGEATAVEVHALGKNAQGHCHVRFAGTTNIRDELQRLGEMPLPPYIERPSVATAVDDTLRYQTVYAKEPGSVAAPTAGLHFTPEVLAQIRTAGAEIHHVTLHVGPGTFSPVKSEAVKDHIMHEESYNVSGETARAVSAAKRDGRRVIAVGTTSVRVLESVAREHGGRIVEGTGRTRIFLHPPCAFQIVDALLTNFHLPQSTLLMLVSAFASPGEARGRDFVMSAYAEAIRERYRFYSYGDAMFVH